MFKFLKDKLKNLVSKFSKEVKEEKKEIKEEAEEKPKEEIKERKLEIKEILEELEEKEEKPEEEIEEKKPEIKEKKKEIIEEKKEEKKEIKKIIEEKREEKPKIKIREEKKIEKPEIKIVMPKEAVKPEIEVKEVEIEEIPEKKGFFERIKERITKTVISEKKFNEFFDELEVVLMENNVALEVIEKIKEDLMREIVEKPLSKGKVEEIIKENLKKSINELFVDNIDLLSRIKEKKPFVICFVGINGSGKTTSMAKVANYLMKNKLSCVFAASDTFRAASIEQLQQHADRLGIKMIKHTYGSDPAAVAFDAIKYAVAKNIDVVLIDTAGRMHSNENLLQEMEKIIRVTKADLKIFVGESITGNDCVEQARKFNEAINIDGIILTKADVDEKGGASISVSYITKKPIMFLGCGQEYGDLKEFDKEIVVKGLGL